MLSFLIFHQVATARCGLGRPAATAMALDYICSLSAILAYCKLLRENAVHMLEKAVHIHLLSFAGAAHEAGGHIY